MVARAHAGPPFVETFPPAGRQENVRYTLHADAEVTAGVKLAELRLPGHSYAEWSPRDVPVTDRGTLTMWVTPLWDPNDTSSHTFMTFNWSGGDQSYFALSQGWWEPQGARKLQVVLSNQQFVGCVMPWRFDFTMFLPNMKTMLGVTWQAGNPGVIRLFVDGRKVCEHRINYSPGRRLLGPIYLGSDRGSGAESRGRSSEVVMDHVVLLGHVSSDEDMHRLFIEGGGADREKWLLVLNQAAPKPDPKYERRMMLDEDTQWAASKLEIQRRIDRIKAAGFNTYAPCVWDGAYAYFRTALAPISPSIHDPTDSEYDPLHYLIARAHAANVEVHPWVDIARRAGGEFPRELFDGAPDHAFNVHSEAFRNFIVGLARDLAARYDVDGVNLDYVRAIGPCSSNECVEAYRRIYNRSLREDWNQQLQGNDVPSMIEWNRKPIGDIVARISSAVRALRPRALLTIDTVPFDHDRQHQGMDEPAWLRSGLVDALVEMAYDDPLNMDSLDQAARSWPASQRIIAVRNYDIFGDSVVNRSGMLLADYVRLIRSRWPGSGVALYHYPHLDSRQSLELRREVFLEEAHAQGRP